MEELSKEELEQLSSYVDDIERNEMYYGNKKEFQERHENIKKCLYNLMNNHEKTIKK